MFKLGYNTNGFAHHSLLSAIDTIGSLGYESIAITIDHHALNPWDENLATKIAQVKQKLETYQLSSVVETGARFLLDPRVKHEPALISKDLKNRKIRLEDMKKTGMTICFLVRGIWILRIFFTRSLIHNTMDR